MATDPRIDEARYRWIQASVKHMVASPRSRMLNGLKKSFQPGSGTLNVLVHYVTICEV
jgi:hypothetical protein